MIGVVGALLTVFGYIGLAYPSLRQVKQDNQRTLSAISCAGVTCDTTGLTTDLQFSGSDYVVDMKTGYLINVPISTIEHPERFAPLDHAETAFIARFREPVSYSTPDGEVWRLYSRRTSLRGTDFEIFIGYAEKAPWKMVDTPDSLIRIVDATLRREADKVAAMLPSQRVAPRGARSSLSADGFVIVDAFTKQVVDWGPWLPTFLPKDTRLPAAGWQSYVYDGDLYLVQTDKNERLLVTSLVHVGSLWWLAGFCATGFFGTTVIARALCRQFLRGYFATTAIRVPTVEEAQQSGEGQSVEFKRGFSDDEAKAGNVEDELLKTVAAFANTNDGVIFIGIDDAGHVRGLALDFVHKDRLERKIRQLIRNRIRPTPPIQVTFEDVRGLVIAKITVARGEATAYMMGGVIYIRYGPSDVQAQPEDLRRLVSQYAY